MCGSEMQSNIKGYSTYPEFSKSIESKDDNYCTVPIYQLQSGLSMQCEVYIVYLR